MKYQGIIFDFNGVLLWDSHLHEKAWKEFSLNLRGYPFTQKEITEHVHGRSNRCVLEYLLQRPVTHQELETHSRKKENIYQKLCWENTNEFQLSPGSIQLFDFLVERNIPRTIATNADRFNLDFYIEHLNLNRWFDVSQIVYNDGTFPGKPAPDTYLRAAEKIGLSPNGCIVIEDSIAGLTAAVKAKIGKIFGLGPKEEHDLLLNFSGVSEVITSLAHFEREKHLCY